MDLFALTLFDGYRVMLAITGLISIGYSLRRGYRMFKQYQKYPDYLRAGIKAGSKASIKSFLQKEKWELVQIMSLLIILCSLYYVFWNLK